MKGAMTLLINARLGLLLERTEVELKLIAEARLRFMSETRHLVSNEGQD